MKAFSTPKIFPVITVILLNFLGESFATESENAIKIPKKFLIQLNNDPLIHCSEGCSVQIPEGTLIRLNKGSLLLADEHFVCEDASRVIELPKGILMQLSDGSLIQLPEGCLVQVPEGALIKLGEESELFATEQLVCKDAFKAVELPGEMRFKFKERFFIQLPEGCVVQIPEDSLISLDEESSLLAEDVDRGVYNLTFLESYKLYNSGACEDAFTSCPNPLKQETVMWLEDTQSSNSTTAQRFECDNSEAYENLNIPYFNQFEERSFIVAEVGYQTFLNLPTFSYGMSGPLGGPFAPSDFLTAKNDQPHTPYIRFGIGTIISSDCLPCWLGEEFSVTAQSFFAQDTLRTNVFVSSPPDYYDFFTGINGVDGISSLLTGTQGGVKREYIYKGIELEIASTYYVDKGKNPFFSKPYVAFDLNQFQQNYGISIYSLVIDPPGIVLDLNESLRTNYYDLGTGLKLELPIGCFSAFIDGGGYMSFAHTSLNAKQLLLFINPTLSVEDKKSLWNGKFKGSVGLNLHSKKMDIGLIGRYEYWGYLPKVVNFQTYASEFLPSPYPVTRIANAFLSTYSIGFYSTVNF